MKWRGKRMNKPGPVGMFGGPYYPGGAETTLEEDIIYNPDISKLINDFTLRYMPDPPDRGPVERLVFNAIREWTGE
jgi:hypothetical protein